MLSVHGGFFTPNRTRLSRRAWLQLGGLAPLGFLGGAAGLTARQTLAREAIHQQSGSQARSFGQAKHCIVLFLFGGPAHQDTFDLKPDAPREVRGAFQPIATSVPGTTISEHLPLLAERTDRFSQIRSVSHPDNTHTVAMHYMLTGVRHPRPATNPQNAADDFPCFGAVINYLESRRGPDSGSRLPRGISLNAPANQVSANNHIFPGFFAGSLGAGFDPLFLSQAPNEPNFQPFTTIDTPERLLDRQALQRVLNGIDRGIDAGAVRTLDRAYAQAFGLLTSSESQRAFDLSLEPIRQRHRYGSTPFGQGCLLARRLVESGVGLVTVNWQRDDAFWDTHKDNFNLHQNQLLPNFDRGFSALLDDLSDRGLLDETLVVVLSEFGRTPKINAAAGRDHWAPCNTVLLAGGGVPGGQVYGASDKIAAYPVRNPVAPEDLAATIYHLLGVNSETPLPNPEGRRQVISTGEVLYGLL
jgi:hypothetical protein